MDYSVFYTCRFYLLFFFLATTSLSICAQSNILTIDASYRGVDVTNRTKFALEVKVGGSVNKSQVVDPGKTWEVTPARGRYWTAGKFSRLKIQTLTSQRARQRSFDLAKAAYGGKIQQAKRARISAREQLKDELTKRVLATLAENIQIDPDDDWLTQLFTATIKAAGRAYNIQGEVRDMYNFWRDKRYGSWENLSDEITDQLIEKGVDEVLSYLSRRISRGDEPTAALLKIVASYAITYRTIEAGFQEAVEAAKMSFEQQQLTITKIYSTEVIQDVETRSVSFRRKPFNFELDLAFSPLNYGSQLNDHWKANPERFSVDKVGEEGRELADALWNQNMEFGVKATITPIFALVGPRNRILVGGSYGSSYFDLANENGSIIPSRFFSKSDSTNFSLRFPIVYQLEQFKYGVTYQIGIGSKVRWNLEGGFLHQRGKYNFKYAEIDIDNFDWAGKRFVVTDFERVPYYSTSLTLGNPNNRFGWQVSSFFFKTNLTLSQPSDAIISGSSNPKDQVGTIDSQGDLIYRILVGIYYRL